MGLPHSSIETPAVAWTSLLFAQNQILLVFSHTLTLRLKASFSSSNQHSIKLKGRGMLKDFDLFFSISPLLNWFKKYFIWINTYTDTIHIQFQKGLRRKLVRIFRNSFSYTFVEIIFAFSTHVSIFFAFFHSCKYF